MNRLAHAAALEALELGEPREAEAILRGALEDGPSERLFPCRVCGLGLEWPGLRWDHEYLVHGLVDEAAA